MDDNSIILEQNKSNVIIDLLPKVGEDELRKEILQGLHQKKKYISSKFFYNKKGSELFEKITNLKEYYPTRTEKTILKNIAYKIMDNYSEYDIIELGSGDCSKISLLFKQIKRKELNTISYMPVDFSKSAIEKSNYCLNQKFPELNIKAFVADFMNQIHLLPNSKGKIICFFGSTIGNLTQEQADEFVQEVSKVMHKEDIFLLGCDMVKDTKVLHDAYNDSENITAEFNLNILNSVNDIIKSDFKPDHFSHKAFYNSDKQRIEMHLQADEDMIIKSPYFKSGLHIYKDETIHTENSHKYSHERIQSLANRGKFDIENIFTDEKNWFSIVQFKKENNE